jgi:hypothetical protein
MSRIEWLSNSTPKAQLQVHFINEYRTDILIKRFDHMESSTVCTPISMPRFDIFLDISDSSFIRIAKLVSDIDPVVETDRTLAYYI